MKKVLLAGLVAGVAMSSTAFAQGVNTDALTQGASVNAGVGMADVFGLDDSATVLAVGYEKAVASVPGVSVGVDTAFSVTEADSDAGYSADYWSVGAFGKYTYGLDALMPNLSVNAKVGYSFVNYELEQMGFTVEGDDNDIVLGAGLAYGLDDHTALTADYVSYDAVDQVTVGVQYAF